ncbi:DNA-3-methyladenine glycosylase [Halomonas sp. McH1-25]|uniref:DNA-3-methyladenine glycosylase n=2 Tax=Halomonas TaxID=2745 RepID=UPI001EF5437B|nr:MULTISPECIES: DNA-3-methyladenine glycosylase [unclassified Halomonas]MCG7601870.1 DNA-3-methyladenine glycosylase [Halomonas sp. McH1-25]MCP1344159.1 DNA-3-methyladenine glycosylase [Halomonas sp. FL8]
MYEVSSALPRTFYARSALEVARDLLGRHLVRHIGQECLVGRIVETEAYGGALDSASHASRGLTPRTAPMFGPPGHAYVYLIYGLHDMLNVVTDPDGEPGAVLIRAMTPVRGEAQMIAHRGGRRGRVLSDGPGKLAQAMNVSVSELNRHDLCLGERLWLAPGEPPPDARVTAGPRIGIDYADPADREAPWRFVIA